MTERASPWVAVAGYGEPGEARELLVTPPPAYRGRYRVKARGLLEGATPASVESITVEARATGAVVTFRGIATATAELPVTLAPASLERLWRDARYLAGWTRRHVGRPSEQDERIAAIVAKVAELGAGATRQAVAIALNRVDEYGELRTDYKRDVRKAGGWPAIVNEARGI